MMNSQANNTAAPSRAPLFATAKPKLLAAAAALALGLSASVVAAPTAQACVPAAEGTSVCLNAWGGEEWIRFPDRGFIAFENLLTGVLLLEQIVPDLNLNGHTGGAELGFHWGRQAHPLSWGMSSWSARAGFNYTWIDDSQSLGRFETGPQIGTGFPGAEGGPFGAFFGFPIEVENMRYRTNFRWGDGYLNLGRAFDLGPAGHHHLEVGAMHSRMRQVEMFGAFVPLFDSYFRQRNQLESRAWGAHAEWSGQLNVGHPIGAWQPMLTGQARGGVANIRGTADVETGWQGPLGQIIDDSRHKDKVTKTAAYWQVGVGAGLQSATTGTRGSLDVTYGERPWFTVPRLDGTNPARAEIEHARVLSVTANLKLLLTPPSDVVVSDIRLKRDIAALARLGNGLHLYSYRYLWSDIVHVGVMAQEVAAVAPEAVVEGPDGFLRVDYARLGLRPMTWKEWDSPASRISEQPTP